MTQPPQRESRGDVEDDPCPLCDTEVGRSSPVLLVDGCCPCCDREFPGVADCPDCGGTGYVVASHGDCSSCPRSGFSRSGGVHSAARCHSHDDDAGLVICPTCQRGAGADVDAGADADVDEDTHADEA